MFMIPVVSARKERSMVPCPRLLPLLLPVLLLGCHPPEGEEETLVFLVRHAERVDDGGMDSEEDPPLSAAGAERAGLLSRMLKGAGLTHIHSSDYARTRQTAAPLADATGIPVDTYDVRDLAALAGQLRTTPGRHLVVGHSNSTPELVAALGGDPRGEIETLEYDRLYLLVIGPRRVETVLMRFGEPFQDGGAEAPEPTGGLSEAHGT